MNIKRHERLDKKSAATLIKALRNDRNRAGLSDSDQTLLRELELGQFRKHFLFCYNESGYPVHKVSLTPEAANFVERIIDQAFGGLL